jgi:dTDP-glucose 4,6-dehydratase/UDP-glucose 4-epimerase
MTELKDDPRDPVPFPIQGTGNETRSFVYVDDFTDGLMTVLEKGEHRNIYNIGSTEEVRVADLVRRIGKYFNREVVVVPGELAKGGTLRRCPDIRKLAALGYQPKMLLSEGLPPTVKWYIENAARAPKRSRPQEVSLT